MKSFFSMAMLAMSFSAIAAPAMAADHSKDTSRAAQDAFDASESPIYIPIGSDEKSHQSGFMMADLNNFATRSAPAFRSLYGMYVGHEGIMRLSVSVREIRPGGVEAEDYKFSITESVGGTEDQRPAQFYHLQHQAYIGSSYQEPNKYGGVSTILVPMTETTGDVLGFYVFGDQAHPQIAVSFQNLVTTMTPFAVSSGEQIDLPTRNVSFLHFTMPMNGGKEQSKEFSADGKRYRLVVTDAEITLAQDASHSF